MEDEKLRSCPFCGAKSYAEKELLRERFGVFCGGCLSQSCFFDTIDAARKSWNKRTPDMKEIVDHFLDGLKDMQHEVIDKKKGEYES